MRILVAYHSRTGRTRRVAERLAQRLGATLHQITSPGLGPGLLGYQRCLMTVLFGQEAAIGRSPGDVADHDLVVLGTPVWAWHASSPVRSFARRHAADIRRCAFFSTSGGPPGARPFDELARHVGQQPLATLALTERELDGDSADARIDAFATTLQTALVQEAPARRAA